MASTANPPGASLLMTPAQLNGSDTAQWLQALKQVSVDTRCATAAFAAEDMDVTNQTVTVQIAVQERVQTSTGAQWWDVKPIIMVPVVIPRAGGVSITLPVKKYDEGMLIFCDTCLDLWWANGRNDAPRAQNLQSGQSPSGSQRQNEIRRHHVHDCGFYPGFYSQPNVLSNYSSSSMQIRTDDGTVLIDVSPSGLTLNGPAITAYDGGAVQVLATNALYQWVINDLVPWMMSKGYAGTGPPVNSVTTVLKGQ